MTTEIAPARHRAAGPHRVLPIVLEKRPTRTAVVLLNVGTPDAPTTSDVRRYLREFLSDPRVIDLPWLGRTLLLYLVILPLRPQKSAAQYRKVWGPDGSPLLAHARALEQGLRARLPGAHVITAMRYGNPGMEAMAAEVQRAGCDHVVLVPLYPQHASASTGSALQRAYQVLGALPRVPNVTVLPELFDDAGFLDAVCATFEEATRDVAFDHVLFSYHGLPLHQVQRLSRGGHRCEGTDGARCCDTLRADNADCYRAQCMATTRMLARTLDLRSHSTSFQSRLGRAQWLLPNTDDHLAELVKRGVRHLVVLCPSFVADCLETVEEIGVRARERFVQLGGTTLTLVPCVNAHPAWVEALARALEPHLPGEVAREPR